MKQRKLIETFIKSTDPAARTVIGIAAVHGNIDAGGDRSHPGAFARAVRDPSRVRFLWQHDNSQPPIARVVKVRELSRAEIPAAVLRKAPEATGALEVTRQYLMHATAEAAYQGVISGALNEMSYAYEVLRYDHSTEKGQRVRELRDLDLLEASDVVWGMNAATVANIAAKALAAKASRPTVDAATLAQFAATAERWQRELGAKEGRVLSASNRQRLASLSAQLAEVQVAIDELLKETEPKGRRPDAATLRQLEATYERHKQAHIRDCMRQIEAWQARNGGTIR